jgi:peptidoglycan/xylan/chitin deacetylase (PgdA/CDA1 family)
MTAPCTIVFYHYVRDVERTPFQGIKALSVDGFRSQLDWLQSRYEVIDGASFEHAVLNGRAFNHPTALLTFDDGFVDHYQHVFPILRERGLGGIFFLSGATVGPTPRLLNVHRTHFLLSALGADRFTRRVSAALAAAGVAVDAAVGRDGIYRYDEAPDVRIKRILNYEAPYPVVDSVLSSMVDEHLGDAEAFARSLYLSEPQIAEMAAAGMTFGFHTETHPVLSRLDRDSQRAELRRGVDLVRALTGQRRVSLCYPYGFPHTYNADTLDVAAACGYSMAFNTVRRDARVGEDPRYELPRFDTRDVPRSDEVPASA